MSLAWRHQLNLEYCTTACARPVHGLKHRSIPPCGLNPDYSGRMSIRIVLPQVQVDTGATCTPAWKCDSLDRTGDTGVTCKLIIKTFPSAWMSVIASTNCHLSSWLAHEPPIDGLDPSIIHPHHLHLTLSEESV